MRFDYGDPLYATSLAIREEVFVEEQNTTMEEELDAYETSCRYYLIESSGEFCGTGRWRHTDGGVKVERIAVHKRYRKQGIGEAVMRAILSDIAIEHPTERVYLHAQKVAEGFYERLGFTGRGATFLKANIVHIAMYK